MVFQVDAFSAVTEMHFLYAVTSLHVLLLSVMLCMHLFTLQLL